jgi:hypothetical protein
MVKEAKTPNYETTQLFEYQHSIRERFAMLE